MVEIVEREDLIITLNNFCERSRLYQRWFEDVDKIFYHDRDWTFKMWQDGKIFPITKQEFEGAQSKKGIEPDEWYDPHGTRFL